jgi:hypothetical protein
MPGSEDNRRRVSFFLFLTPAESKDLGEPELETPTYFTLFHEIGRAELPFVPYNLASCLSFGISKGGLNKELV